MARVAIIVSLVVSLISFAAMSATEKKLGEVNDSLAVLEDLESDSEGEDFQKKKPREVRKLLEHASAVLGEEATEAAFDEAMREKERP